MSKYIIKNCEQIHSSDNFCWSKNVLCQDCTDCKLKQIVELAKGYKDELIDRKTKKVVATRYFKLTKEILELLDIQEEE